MQTDSIQDTVNRALFDILSWLRNGATVTGSDGRVTVFREQCLEQAYVIMSQDLVPALAALGLVPTRPDCNHQDVRSPNTERIVELEDQRMGNLIDISSMMQKQIIQRPPPLLLLHHAAH
jgi:hypothetical protein